MLLALSFLYLVYAGALVFGAERLRGGRLAEGLLVLSPVPTPFVGSYWYWQDRIELNPRYFDAVTADVGAFLLASFVSLALVAYVPWRIYWRRTRSPAVAFLSVGNVVGFLTLAAAVNVAAFALFGHHILFILTAFRDIGLSWVSLLFVAAAAPVAVVVLAAEAILGTISGYFVLAASLILSLIPYGFLFWLVGKRSVDPHSRLGRRWAYGLTVLSLLMSQSTWSMIFFYIWRY